jgi:regulator of PEP synthase PpsR (kinase-PPPase family)
VLNSALAQFVDPDVEIVSKTGIRSQSAGVSAVDLAAERGAVICHSLVDPQVRTAVITRAEQRHVPIVDVLGPVLTLLSDHLDTHPRYQPGLSYALQKRQFDLYNAVDFTLSHDDGAGMRDVDKADVVLVGISRTCKSVTCFYLAYRGVRAANVPLIPGCEPPEELRRVDPERVVGLTMNAQRLSKVREARFHRLQSDGLESYVSAREIIGELRHAADVMARHGWRCLDVSYLSVEEVAKEVLVLLAQKTAR